VTAAGGHLIGAAVDAKKQHKLRICEGFPTFPYNRRAPGLLAGFNESNHEQQKGV
jgi:hypothetical protein